MKMQLIAIAFVVFLTNAVLLAFSGVVAFLLHLALPSVEIGTILIVATISIVGSIVILLQVFSNHPMVFPTQQFVENQSDDDDSDSDAYENEWADSFSRRSSPRRARGRRR